MRSNCYHQKVVADGFSLINKLFFSRALLAENTNGKEAKFKRIFDKIFIICLEISQEKYFTGIARTLTRRQLRC